MAKRGIFGSTEKIMGAKVKPVQPTEIKDKKIAHEVIEQIRKPIPASVYKRHEKKPPISIRFSNRPSCVKNLRKDLYRQAAYNP
jgi:hypothetical protein